MSYKLICMFLMILFFNVSFSQVKTQFKIYKKVADSIICENSNVGNLEVKFDKKFSRTQIIGTVVTERIIFNVYQYIYAYSFFVGRREVFSCSIHIGNKGNIEENEETFEIINALWEANRLNYFNELNDIDQHIAKLGINSRNFNVTIRSKNSELFWILIPKNPTNYNFGYQIKIGNDRTVSLIPPSEIVKTFGY